MRAIDAFITRLFSMLERVSPQSQGLDFGCGPGPTLSLMLEEAGHSMALYDIFYHPDTQVLNRQYDFMTATEVIEHLQDPHRVWQQWLNLVARRLDWSDDKMVKDLDAFAGWHYKNDLTHEIFLVLLRFSIWRSGISSNLNLLVMM